MYSQVLNSACNIVKGCYGSTEPLLAMACRVLSSVPDAFMHDVPGAIHDVHSGVHVCEQ